MFSLFPAPRGSGVFRGTWATMWLVDSDFSGISRESLGILRKFSGFSKGAPFENPENFRKIPRDSREIPEKSESTSHIVAQVPRKTPDPRGAGNKENTEKKKQD